MTIDFERREKRRFAMEREVRYRIADYRSQGAVGSGHTINVSSGGIAFVAEQPLAPGTFLELSVSWPVLLGETCPMRFVALGRILRCSGLEAVCTIEKYEFRTQARSVRPVVPTRTDGLLQRWVDEVRRENLKVTAAGI